MILQPAERRQIMQTKYDNYMSGRSLLLGMKPGSIGEFSSDDLNVRDAKIEAYASLFPKKTRALAARIVHKALFIEASKLNHINGGHKLLGEYGRAIGKKPVGYFSGIGRNAVGVTLVDFEGPRTLIVPPRLALEVIQEVRMAGILIDPDFGMGEYAKDGRQTPRAAVAETQNSEWLKVQGAQELATA